jgi:Zn finger protein HypA/HybF involved in hydrogenase expression
MLATITRTNVDIVRSAVKVFSQLQMMEILDDGTIYMREVQKMLGCESYWAEQKRLQRQKRTLIGQSPTCPSKSIDIDKDKELEIDTEIEKEEINKKESINQSSVDVDSIFKKMMQELERVISPITFETFFRPLKHNGVLSNRLVLVAQPIMLDVIENKYRAQLESALLKASDRKLIDVVWEEES